MSFDACLLIDRVNEIAMDAGHTIMKIYATDFRVQHKADLSPVTEADIAANNVIVSGLNALAPKLPILSEESEEAHFTERSKWQSYWLVDPLDGTREFVKRNGEFTVNIALIEQHRPILGVVYAPVDNVLYYACHGMGAYKVAADQAAVRIQTKPWHGKEAVVVIGSRSHGSARIQSFLENIGHHTFIRLGSSLKSCIVAEGRADVYPRFGPTSEWDTAAAQCIVEEAGGCLTDMKMQSLRYNTKESLTNPPFVVVGDPHHPWAEFLE
jgi:3'(2'), 5'-bisphosphate nucleotidase